jgi:hypothetical protein
MPYRWYAHYWYVVVLSRLVSSHSLNSTDSQKRITVDTLTMTPQELKKLCDDCASNANAGKESVRRYFIFAMMLEADHRLCLAFVGSTGATEQTGTAGCSVRVRSEGENPISRNTPFGKVDNFLISDSRHPKPAQPSTSYRKTLPPLSQHSPSRS